MYLSLIVAVGNDRQIGKDNQLLWHLKEDLKRFKSLTLNHPVVMGKQTFLSIGKALPKRTNIVITKNPEEFLSTWGKSYPDLIALDHPDMVLDWGLEVEERTGEELEVFVIGGEQIYKHFLPLARKIYLTEVDYKGEGDRFFPEISPELFEVTDMSPWFLDDDSGLRFRYITLELSFDQTSEESMAMNILFPSIT
jgi:dihydrofolate reductase